MAEPRIKEMSLYEFLAWEEQQEARFEFSGGQALLMAGGTDAHDDVRGALYSVLRAKLASSGCRVRLDLKLVCPTGRSRYPDTAVVCGPRDPKATELTNPVLLVEVLSPSTRSTDYLVKPVDYASVPSVMTYLIVDPDEPRIDVLRRSGDRLEPSGQAEGLDGVIALPELGIDLPLSEVYPASAQPDAPAR